MVVVVALAGGLAGLGTGPFLNAVISSVPAADPTSPDPAGDPTPPDPTAPDPAGAPPAAAPDPTVAARRGPAARCGCPPGTLRYTPALVPWLVAGRRCRACGEPIALRYPLVEVLTAVLWLLVAARFGLSWTLPAELAFVSGLVALGAVDAERLLLPRAILYPTLALVAAGVLAAAAALGRWDRLATAAACGLGAFAVFAGLHAVRPAWLAFGDVRMAALLGLALGWLGPLYLLLGLVTANVLGAAVGIGLVATGRARRTTPLPYGVFLGAGSVLALLAGGPLVAAYASSIGR